ncbi:MAG: antibiotic biosynthesis monooxygenase [Gammaproteobacteria bacterium HGW-Gammaproteobacteria-14]|nr:MAG: antibiotic biosynthesis monooxygenase [Gammaproteobacteria bacterium HGW-Gammaproteobacteria-14]
MIIVKGSIPVKADRREEAVALVQLLAETSRRESGCLSYEVYIQADAPEVIVIWQQWDSVDALEDHFASDHVDHFLDAIPDLIEGEVTSAQFAVQEESWSEIEEPIELPRVQYADNIVLH